MLLWVEEGAGQMLESRGFERWRGGPKGEGAIPCAWAGGWEWL